MGGKVIVNQSVLSDKTGIVYKSRLSLATQAEAKA